MKKLIIICSVLCLLWLNMGLYFICSANMKFETINSDVALIINTQLTREERAVLLNQENYSQTLIDIDLTDAVILKEYHVSYWANAHLPLTKLLSEINKLPQRKTQYYWVLSDRPFAIQTFTQDEKVSVHADKQDSDPPKYITDIIHTNDAETFDGKASKVNGIYCFDDSFSNAGTAIYIDTDNGVYVRFYEQPTSEAIVFTEQEFQKFGGAYYKHITSPENNYSSSGAPIYGGNNSFLSFVNNYTEPTSTPPTLLITIGIITLIGVITTIVWICEHRHIDKHQAHVK